MTHTYLTRPKELDAAKKGENQIESDRAGRSHLTNQDDKRRCAGDVN